MFYGDIRVSFRKRVFRQATCLPKAATASSLFSYTLNIVSRFVRRSRSLTRVRGRGQLEFASSVSRRDEESH